MPFALVAALVTAVVVGVWCAEPVQAKLHPTEGEVAAVMLTKINRQAAKAGTPGLVKTITCEETGAPLSVRHHRMLRSWYCTVTYKNDTVNHMITHIVQGKLTWGGN
jgi:hypothetical protein